MLVQNSRPRFAHYNVTPLLISDNSTPRAPGRCGLPLDVMTTVVVATAGETVLLRIGFDYTLAYQGDAVPSHSRRCHSYCTP